MRRGERGQCVSRQPEHHLRRRETGYRMLAEAPELVREVRGKIGGRDDGFAEFGRNLLQPRREIDRRADAGEVEAVAAADIAVHHLADMQRKPEADRLFVLGLARQFGDARFALRARTTARGGKPRRHRRRRRSEKSPASRRP